MPAEILTERRSQLSEAKRELLARRLQAAKGPAEAAIPPRSPDEPIPLAFSQQRMWFLEQLEPGTPTYNCRTALRIEGQLDVGAFGRALRGLLARHESLRTVVALTDGEPFQRVCERFELVLPVIDLGRLRPDAREALVQQLADEEGQRPIGLGAPPLLRTTLLRSGRVEVVLLLTCHHLVWDGWSMGIFSRELAALYEAELHARPALLKPLPIQYPDFAIWQKGWLVGSTLAAQLKFWRQRLGRDPVALELPLDHARPSVSTHRGSACYFWLSSDLSRQLVSFAQRRRLTLFMLMLAAFKVLLHRLTGQTDLVAGTPIAGRQRAQTEPLIGLFVNTLVLRSDLGGNPSFEALSEAVRETTLESFAHADLPFEKLVEELAPERSLSHPPLFQVMFVLQNAPAEQLEVAGLRFRSLGTRRPAAKLDLTLEILEQGEMLSGSLVYKNELFDATTMRRWAGQLKTLLAQLPQQAQRPIGELSPLGAAERHQLLIEHTDTGEARASATVVELLEHHLEQGRDAVAAAFEHSWLSYGELERRSGRLAAWLRARGVGPEVGMALCLEPSLEMVVGMVGALRSGGYYVPIDPELAPERRSFLLEDSKARLVLDGAVVARLSGSGSMDGGAARPPRPGALAYVIYTSGSTGLPKGVLVEHAQLYSYIEGVTERFGLAAGSSWATVSTPAADLGNTAIFGALCGGGALHVLARERVTDAVAMGMYLAQRRVDCLKIVPSHLGALMASSLQPQQLLPARLLVIGGEACPLPLARCLRELAPWCRLVNHYGPTETTVGVLTLEIGDGWRELRELPLGRGIRGTRQIVVGRRQELVGLGVVGEIQIGGANVTRGYLGRPGATAERFVPDPFVIEPGARLYRTGDLARWRSDGTLEFLGRLDHQVKLRGYRIELGEVEAALRGCAGVEDAVVMLCGAGESKRLVAWVVPAGEEAPPVATLRRQLEATLTSQAVPSAIVALAALPRLGTGKIDRRSLPEPGVEAAETAEWSAPEGWLEQELAAIWGEVLGLERVGAGDDFFGLGGHSLLAVRLIARVRASFGVELTLRALFETPHLRDQARQVEQARLDHAGARVPALVRVGRERRLPLSFAQERLWFLDRLMPGSAAYNVPSVQRLSEPMRVGALAWAFGEVVRRHESLRTRIELVEDTPAQVIDAPGAWVLPVVDLKRLGSTSCEREARRLARAEAGRAFDLERGPLLRTSLVRLGERDWLLLVTLHHVVSDGWSRRILAREVRELVRSVEEERAPRLGELPVQYADYAVWQRTWLTGEVMARELEFWRGQLEGAPAVLELPTDRPRPVLQRYRGRTLGVSLGKELSGRLAVFARRNGTTQFTVLLTGFQLLLGRLSGQRDVVVGTPIAGRNRLEVEGLIGFFVNTLALRAQLLPAEGFAALLGRVREVVLDAHAHQELPFEKLVEELRPERSLSHGPLFQAMLVLESYEREGMSAGTGGGVASAEPAAAKFDLSVSLAPVGEQLCGVLEHDVDLFDATTMRRFARQYGALLSAALAAPERSVWELALLAPSERQQMLVEWNATTPVEGSELSVERLIARHLAAGISERVAVRHEGRWLSYGALWTAARGLSAQLVGVGAGPERVVAICTPRSLEMVVAVLGVLDARAAYLPLDLRSPPARWRELMVDAGAVAVLGDAASLERLDPKTLSRLGITSLELPIDGSRPLPARRSVGASAPRHRDQLAYVIYTSGSTGRPKGVGISHHSLTAHTLDARAAYGTREEDRLLQFAPLSFDASVEEIFPTLITGAELVLCSDEMVGPPAVFFAGCRAERITMLSLPTAYWHELAVASAAVPPEVRTLMIGGERARADLVAAWLEHLVTGVALCNSYGPTEATVVSTRWWVTAESAQGSEVPIGRAVYQVRTFVLDCELGVLPVGVPGQLAIAGIGLARGYLGRPAVTAAVFVPDPLGGDGERLYLTGDRARWRPKGELECLGRFDHQVKVRGFRIELGEIEAHLVAHPEVREAVVLARSEGDRGGFEPSLVAYVVAPSEGLTPARLRAFVEHRLPSYMVPSVFVLLASLPMTSSGKIDRKALPAPEQRSERVFRAPSGQAEELLAQIWAEVLGLERVGRDDDFFHLGGHSLLATRVLSRVRRALRVEVPVRILFESPVLADFARQVEVLRTERGGERPPLVAVPRLAELPLSFAQERLWFLDQLEPGNPAYNIPGAYRIEGPLRIAVLARALEELAARHEALRTRFEARDGVPVQVIEPAGELGLPMVDLAALTAAEREARVRRLAAAQARRPFDLRRGPLVRATLLREGAQRHALLLDLHHVVGDGWSMGIVAREMAVLYTAFCAGRPSPLAPLEIQPADYAVWQRSWLRGEVLEDEIAHWRQRLTGAPAVLELPSDRPRPAVVSGGGASRSQVIGAGTSSALRGFGRRLGATPFMVLLAAYQSLLGRYAGQSEVCVGTPIAGRDRVEIEGLIGFFVNTLVLRTDLGGDPDFETLVARVREVGLEAHTHQDLPFEKLVEQLQPERSLAHSPLFQAMFTLQAPEDATPGLGGLRVSGLARGSQTTKFDLQLAATDIGAGFELVLTYRRDLFDATTVSRLLRHLESLLSAALAEPQRSLVRLPLLVACERHQLLIEHNDTAVAWPSALLLQAPLLAQAARTPDAVAVESFGAALSYAGLEQRTTRLARMLAARGVGPEVRVGVCFERSIELVVAILGVLEAGATYVPLEPSYPRERLAWIIEDAQIRLVLSAGEAAEPLRAIAAEVVSLDRPETWELSGRVVAKASLHPEHAAYAIYTSGSTGRPKGVVVSHRAVANHHRWLADEIALADSDAVAQKTSIGFDPSISELFVPWERGARLVLAPVGAQSDPTALVTSLLRHRVTVLQLVPAQLGSLLEEPDLPSCRALRCVVCGGDVLPLEWVGRLLERLQVAVYNFYGPTEAAIDVTSCRVAGRLSAAGPAPLGFPISNLRVHVLGRDLRAQPLGVWGELCLGGLGLARGYLGRPGTTAQRWVPDALSELEGARLYRTGDRVRRRADGTLEYGGRLDRQVKLRGLRIELGEIEAVLGRHPAVREAVVVRSERGAAQPRLVGYVVPGPSPATTAQLHAFLEQELPAYMVPSIFVSLESLPLTPGGKIDRQALPLPEQLSERGFRPPSGPVEEVLAEIWGEVLGLERVGRDDDFFHLGGHSLLATRVLSRVRRALGVEVPVRTLFESPVLADFARQLEALRAERGGERPPLVPVARTDDLPLSFAQERLWFLDQLEPGNPAYNIPGAYRIEGPLRIAVLARALEELVARHEVLRTRFETRDGVPVQVIEPAGRFPLPVIDLAGLPAAVREARVRRLAAAQARRPFDLRRGPLVRATLLREDEQRHALLLDLHHVASDGWSMGIVAGEMAALYEALGAGRPSPLAPLAIQYADFALWQRSWLAGEVLALEIAHWRERLAGAPAVLELPGDRPRPAVLSGRGASRSAALGARLSAVVRDFSRQLGATPFMVLLSAFQALLGRYSGQTDVSVGTPIAGRNRLEIEGLIGFFVNTLVLRADLGADPGFELLVRRVREVCLEAHTHQEVPFEKLVEELQPERSLAHSPLFQVMFAFQAPEAATPGFGGLEIATLAGRAQTAKFDLQLSVTDGRGGFDLALTYSRDLFDGATAGRMLGHFQNLLAHALTSPGCRLSGLPLLSGAERFQLLREWSDTGRPVSGSRGLHELVRAQTAQTPEAIALAWGGRGEALSYGELERRSHRLAGYLRGLGAGPEVRVGVALERSPELVVALLGVLASGGAYVPLDPAYPRERLELMLADSQTELVLTGSDLLERLPGGVGRVVRLDRDAWLDAPAEPGEVAVHAQSLSHLLYTSGSTGRPKAVAIVQGAAVALVAWAVARFGRDRLDGMLASTSINFDLSVFELFAPLACGGRVVLARDVLEGAGLADERVRMINTVPSALTEVMRDRGLPGSVEVVGLAGEPLPRQLADRLYREPGVREVWNLYGPSEDTTYSTFACVPRVAERPPAIGRPIAGSRAYVVDAGSRPVPIGIVGELMLAGAGLARGYLGRAGLTAQRFVPDELSGEPGARRYRTGDLARQLADGEIEALGRRDHQVKVRGFRIELGEIETVLRGCPEIAQAVVVVADTGEQGRQLVACVVPARGRLEWQPLRRRLAERLPDYMLPAMAVELAELPLDPNGKVDRRAIAALALGSRERQRPYRPPATPVEELLAEIWAEVLGLERVGLDDSFFELGGHSLLATRVASRLRASLGVELPLRVLFEAPTVAGLASRVEIELRLGAGLHLPKIVPVPRDQALEPSYAQEWFWFLDRLEPGSAIYNVPKVYRFQGRLDVAALRLAIDGLVERHEVLRTSFEEIDGRPWQRIAPALRVALPEIDLERLVAADRLREARRRARELISHPFDLRCRPVLRFALLRLAPADRVILLAIHHIASDGWSIDILAREVITLYQGFAERRPVQLAALPVQYADYAAWQRRWLGEEQLERELDFWRRRLASAPPVLELPTDRPRPPVRSSRGALCTIVPPEDLYRRFQTLGQRHGASTFITQLTAFLTLLARTTGQRDVVVGTVTAGRGRLEVEGLIGSFVNTLVLRADLGDDPSFEQALLRVRDVVFETHAHQDLPFEKLVEKLAPRRSLAHSPLFQVMVLVQYALPVKAPAELTVTDFELEGHFAAFDLVVAVGESLASRQGSIQYSVDLFDRSTIERLARGFETLLAAGAAEPGRRLSRLPLFTAAEQAQLTREWNDTAAAVEARGFHELFAIQAQRAPEAVAVAAADRDGGEQALSYGELARRAGELAHRLAALGVGPEVPVGVLMERAPELMVAVMGVLAAGGVYTPLDPRYPRERLGFMIAQAGVSVLLSQERLAALAAGLGVRVIALDAAPIGTEPMRATPMRATPVRATRMGWSSEQPAYVIFTSGSTGRPKGVVVTHRGASNLAAAQRRWFGVGPGERVLQFSSISFDASVFEMVTALGSGATLVLAGGEMLVGEELAAVLRARRVSVATLPPSVVLALPAAEIEGLRTLTVAGEACSRELVERWAPGRRFFNLYGPTETTIWASAVECRAGGDVPTIGRPIANTRIYLLDRELELVPAGVAGELHIGGVSLARGYLGRASLSAERFIPDPWGCGDRLYKSGDLARYRGDGELEFLGRTDHQVKIRGVRIELGEVVAVLRSHAEVADAVVVARQEEDAERRLVAYVVPRPDAVAPAAGELRLLLRERLPEAMIPSAFVALTAFPLTPSGKIDRRALPAPSAAHAGAGEAMPPRDRVELELVGLWEELLGLRGIGVRDDFFDLGGHSLAALRLCALIEKRFGRPLPLRELFVATTIERLAARLRHDAPPASSACRVALRSQGGRAPWFWVHPAGGSVLCYLALARELGDDQPVFAFESWGLQTGREPDTTLEAMAARYVEQMREAQARGPYLLGGWSMGGAVAFEMARQLEAAGEQVACLALLDAHSPLFAGAEAARLSARSLLLAFVRDLGWALEETAFLQATQGLDEEQLLVYAWQQACREGLLAPDSELGHWRHLFEVFKINVRALASCRPRRCNSPVMVLRAAASGAAPGSDPLLGWGEWLGGPVETVAVPGDHFSLLSQPNVRHLVALLEARPQPKIKG